MGNVIVLALVGVFFVALCVCIIREHIYIMKRARKIDPSVKTRAEADHVLEKDVAKSINLSGGTIYCKNCGTQIDEDSKFCKKCGKEQ